MQISENFSAPTKATPGRPAYAPAIYQIQSAIAKLLVSFRCQVKIREGQAGETAWCYSCSLVIVIVNSKLIKRHSKAKRRAPAYSRPLRQIRGVSKEKSPLLLAQQLSGIAPSQSVMMADV